MSIEIFGFSRTSENKQNKEKLVNKMWQKKFFFYLETIISANLWYIDLKTNHEKYYGYNSLK